MKKKIAKQFIFYIYEQSDAISDRFIPVTDVYVPWFHGSSLELCRNYGKTNSE